MDYGTNPTWGFFPVRCTSVTYGCMCPLSAVSDVFLELDLTGLFHWGSVGGPIKRGSGMKLIEEILSPRYVREGFH